MNPLSRFIDPAELSRLNDLELLARTVVEGFRAGLHRSVQHGASIEFSQYRAYAQGEDPRFVDWKLYGRSDRLYLKQSQEDTNLRCTFLLDRSASMDYGSGAITKFEYARMLVASLAMLLHQQHDAVGLMAYHDRVDPYLPAQPQRRHFHRMLVELARLMPAGSTGTGESLRYLGQVLPPRGMIVLVSDLLHPVEDTLAQLRSLRARRHEVVVLQISDRAELTFPFDQSATFVDAEAAGERFAIPDLVREKYLDSRREHFSRIREACLAAEIDIEEFVSDEPLDHALHAFLRRRRRSLLRSGAANVAVGQGGGR
jgi:uncharacterized protein (DUF58 family)